MSNETGGGWWEGKMNERRALFTRLAETSAPGKRCGQNVRGRSVLGRNVQDRNVRGQNVRQPSNTQDCTQEAGEDGGGNSITDMEPLKRSSRMLLNCYCKDEHSNGGDVSVWRDERSLESLVRSDDDLVTVAAEVLRCARDLQTGGD